MTATATWRQSADPLSTPFTAYVLLSEGLELASREILEAVVDDFPSMFWTSRFGGDQTCSTDQTCHVVFHPEPGRNEPKEVHVYTEPGRFHTHWDASCARSEMFFSDARAAVERHKSFIAITVASADESVAARFEAASRMTCLAAVFAKLPTCTAVHVAHSGLIVSPAAWVKAADTLVGGEVPVWQWIAAPIELHKDRKEPTPVTLRTIGLAQLAGREIVFPQVRAEPKELMLFTVAVATAVLKMGTVLQDGETFDIPGAPDRNIPIRHWPAAKGGAASDMWALVHSKSTLNESGPEAPQATGTTASAGPGSRQQVRSAETQPQGGKSSFLQRTLGSLLRGSTRKVEAKPAPAAQPAPAARPTPKREKPLNSSFSAYVLLTEDIRFVPSELLRTATRGFPGLSWSIEPHLDVPFSTDRPSIAPLLATEDMRDVKLINFIAKPGTLDLEWEPIYQLSQLTFPDARDAVNRHRAYLSINVTSVDDSLAARFSAARRMTCLASLFARLPSCTGIWLQNSNTLIPPKTWIASADMAMDDTFPIATWVSLVIGKETGDQDSELLWARTVGLSSFIGREIMIPKVRRNWRQLPPQLMLATHQLMNLGHRFNDGDTMALHDDPESICRIRNWPAAANDFGVDMWAILYPDAAMDEMSTFGPRLAKPLAPGQKNDIPHDEDYLCKLLREFNQKPTLH
ncbi:hypothetical protein [Tabrizicola sp.]|uniref:hypothetical protein n=1 Tax=Tabrizicola sp. TaxID=2005166 RepID=UPI003F2F7E0A